MFCPKCKSILLPRKIDGKAVIKCSCGYEDTKQEQLQISEKVKEHGGDLAVVDQDEDKRLPLTDAECPQCGHTKAYYWLIQTRASDEPETKFQKCEQCKHTWRDYS